MSSAADSLLKKKDDKYPYSETFLVFFPLYQPMNFDDLGNHGSECNHLNICKYGK